MSMRFHLAATYAAGTFHSTSPFATPQWKVIVCLIETATFGDRLPIEAISRTRKSASSTLDLPPPFRLVPLRETGDAFAHARTIASEEGAGALIRVGRFDVVEFAVVLEPEEPLRIARRAFLRRNGRAHERVGGFCAAPPPDQPRLARRHPYRWSADRGRSSCMAAAIR